MLSIRFVTPSPMMFAKKDVDAEKAQQHGVKQVREWLESLLPEDERDEEEGGKAPSGKETSVIVNQLACKEVGCPDVEVVMTLLRAKPRSKLMFKLYKAAADLTKDEVAAAMNEALAEERAVAAGERAGLFTQRSNEPAVAPAAEAHEHAESHGHGHADTALVDDCACGHDHADNPHAEGKEHEHEHDGHAHEEHGHGHDEGHGHGHKEGSGHMEVS